jgi:hypothetical protein
MADLSRARNLCRAELEDLEKWANERDAYGQRRIPRSRVFQLGVECDQMSELDQAGKPYCCGHVAIECCALSSFHSSFAATVRAYQFDRASTLSFESNVQCPLFTLHALHCTSCWATFATLSSRAAEATDSSCNWRVCSSVYSAT